MARKKLTFTQRLEKLTVAITTWVGTPQSIIVHTLFFILTFSLLLIGIGLDKILLILTTAVSLEAIYLALFIQMTVNRNTESLEDVTEDIDEIQEDVEGLEKDVDRIQEDVQGVEEDVEDITEDIAEIQEEEESEEDKTFIAIEGQLTKLVQNMQTLREEIQSLKHPHKS